MGVSNRTPFMGGAIGILSILPFLTATPFVSAQKTPYFPISVYPSNPLDGDLVEVSISNVNDLAASARFFWYHDGSAVREVEKTFTDTLLSDSNVVQSGEWTVAVYLYDRTESKQLINSSTISFTVQPAPTSSPTTVSPAPTPAIPAPTPAIQKEGKTEERKSDTEPTAPTVEGTKIAIPANATEESVNRTESPPQQPFRFPLGAETGILGLVIALDLRRRV